MWGKKSRLPKSCSLSLDITLNNDDLIENRIQFLQSDTLVTNSAMAVEVAAALAPLAAWFAAVNQTVGEPYLVRFPHTGKEQFLIHIPGRGLSHPPSPTLLSRSV